MVVSSESFASAKSVASARNGKDIKPLQTPNAVLLLGLALGVLADGLWWSGGPTGPGFVIWVAISGLSACWLVRRTRADRSEEVILWSMVGFAAACTLLFRTTPMVILAMGLVMIVASAMVTMQKNDVPLRETTVADHLLSMLKVPVHCLFSAMGMLGKVDIGTSLINPRFRSLVRGVFLSIPILVLFTVLFSSADAVFSGYAFEVLELFSPESLRHLLVIAVLAWVSSGILAGVSEKHFLVNRKRKNYLKLGTDDTAVFLGLVVALFLVFVYLQLGYLFGGRETIESTYGLTLAAYARRGFFELIAVSGLTLGLLILISTTNCNQRIFRPMAAILVACVVVILASAGQRLYLYIIEFGLTIDRLFAAGVMAWLAISLALFAFTVLRGRVKDFAAGLTVTGIVVMFLLSLANPAAVVASVNIDRAVNNNQQVDVVHLLSLGSDAVPTVLARVESLPVEARCQVAMNLLRRWDPRTDNGNDYQDWRWWNASRTLARNIVAQQNAKLQQIAAFCIN